jgi:hypothetical protein
MNNISANVKEVKKGEEGLVSSKDGFLRMELWIER